MNKQIKRNQTQQNRQMDQEIQIIEGLILVDWSKLRNLSFMGRYQVSLVIHATIEHIPKHLCPNVKIICVEWSTDQSKFSPIILRYKFVEALQKLQHQSQKCQSTLICDYGVTPASLGLCCLLLMTKFSWSLLKTLEFLSSRIHLLDFSDQQIRCLIFYDQYLHPEQSQLQSNIILWREDNQISQQAKLARNTFLNSIQTKMYKLDSELSQSSKPLRTLKKKVSFSFQQNKCQRLNYSAKSKSNTQFNVRVQNHDDQPAFPKIRKTSESLSLNIVPRHRKGLAPISLDKKQQIIQSNSLPLKINKNILRHQQKLQTHEDKQLVGLDQKTLKKINEKMKQKFHLRSYILQNKVKHVKNRRRQGLNRICTQKAT